jgi:hypothetical protein
VCDISAVSVQEEKSIFWVMGKNKPATYFNSVFSLNIGFLKGKIYIIRSKINFPGRNEYAAALDIFDVYKD